MIVLPNCPLPGAVVYFGYNQPNNFDLDQQCGIVDTNIEVKMADEKCVRTFSYLCDMCE